MSEEDLMGFSVGDKLTDPESHRKRVSGHLGRGVTGEQADLSIDGGPVVD